LSKLGESKVILAGCTLRFLAVKMGYGRTSGTAIWMLACGNNWRHPASTLEDIKSQPREYFVNGLNLHPHHNTGDTPTI